MSWASRIAILAVIISVLTVAACTGSATSMAPPVKPAKTVKPLKFLTAPVALAHADASTDIPIQVNNPGAKISEYGLMPSGLSFLGGPGGTAAVVGVPGSDAGGSYQMQLLAVDGSQRVSQELTLSVDEAPYFPSIDNTTFGANEGHGNQDEIFATGYPMPRLSCAGALPGGFTCTQTGIGAVTISGSPGTFEGPCSSQVTVLAVSPSGTATLPMTIKLGDGWCFLNLFGSWASQISGTILRLGKPVGQWLSQNGKKVAAWVWDHGRAVVRSPQAEEGAEIAAASE